ncbi:hypothetical protein [Nocardia flavorosea]|uniref:Glycosyltransferase n=1 Tax=Nocardia flavorosea TaxID=53429 RepID=A0A846YTJ5_9NOCA|nr:hypothetical protein [Nocardia flavorosea]NKY60870.1 hypothetical protein [Nocardia flavorosea]
MDPSRCIVLVPVGHHIEPACDEALKQLERRGYQVRRRYGSAAIDQARSRLATDALAEGFDELMWIDSDTGFDPDAVEQLRAHELPLVGGVCVKKGARALACHILPGTERFVLGEGGGLTEVRYVGTGFLHTRREVYEKIAEHEKLPVCNQKFGTPTVPYFLPMLLPEDDGNHWYLGEDFAFTERARRCGFDVYVDTSFRLEHIGTYGYTWEDAGTDKPRYGSYNYYFK